MSEAYAFKEEQKFTYADYKTWELKPGERFELIYGEAYAMSAPAIVHQRILMKLAGECYVFLKGKKCEVFAAPVDVRLFYEEDESDDTVVQPDIIVVCDSEKLGDEGCRGAPDLVVEILSPSNTAIEMERKLNLYREALVREYWVVDPKNKHIRIYHLRNSDLRNEEYLLQTCRIDDVIRTDILPGLEIPVADVFAES